MAKDGTFRWNKTNLARPNTSNNNIPWQNIFTVTITPENYSSIIWVEGHIVGSIGYSGTNEPSITYPVRKVIGTQTTGLLGSADFSVLGKQIVHNTQASVSQYEPYSFRVPFCANTTEDIKINLGIQAYRNIAGTRVRWSASDFYLNRGNWPIDPGIRIATSDPNVSLTAEIFSYLMVYQEKEDGKLEFEETTTWDNE